MNENQFGTSWGGEDWELLDRIIMAGYYVIHNRLPRFYHIFHSNHDTWDGLKLRWPTTTIHMLHIDLVDQMLLNSTKWLYPFKERTIFIQQINYFHPTNYLHIQQIDYLQSKNYLYIQRGTIFIPRIIYLFNQWIIYVFNGWINVFNRWTYSTKKN